MTKLDELRALMAAATPGQIDIHSAALANAAVNALPALIAAVEAAQEVYREWDEDKEPDESCHLYPSHYKRLGAALAPFGDDDEQKV